ncbi:MAG: hypothetical protein ACYDDS_03290 [Candidatus Sulfotelmatobacter sp.]
MPEPRSLVMTVVEVSWEDPGGTLQTVPARMEDRSASGACIRINARIVVGSKLRIQSHWEQFSGTAKYCRGEGEDYIVGIQRDAAPSAIPAAPQEIRWQESAKRVEVGFSTARIIPSLPKQQEDPLSESPVVHQELAHQEVECVPIVRLASAVPHMHAHELDREIDRRGEPRFSKFEDFETLRWAGPPSKQPPNVELADNEKKPVPRKWLELAGWRDKHRNLSGSRDDKNGGNGNRNDNDKHKDKDTNNDKDKSQSWKRAPSELVHKGKKPSAELTAEDTASPHVELLQVEEIYREAGIRNPRSGYSIGKVVEMLHSERLRGVSKEMRQAAVLMALEAAGIPLDQVFEDARKHLEALDNYEQEQRKQLEAGCVWKAEENLQIEAEMERAKAHHMARISRNEDDIEREKATFGDWQAMKRREAQSISEAAELCSESMISEPDQDSRANYPEKT